MIFEPMKRSEIAECAELAAQAFYDYVYFTNYFPDGKARLDFMRKMLTSVYRTHYGKAHYLVGKQDGKIVAVADLHSPAFSKPGDMSYMLRGWWKVLLIRPSEPVKEWLRMDEEASSFCHSLTEGTTWYLSSLTIHPDYQHQGIGTSMLNDGIIPYVCQRGATGLCLFTNNESNLNFYSKLGFKLLDTRQFTYNGLTMGSWSLAKHLTVNE